MFASSATTSETTSNSYSNSTFLWGLTLAENLPVLLIVFPGILMYFLSTSTPALANSSAKVALLIEPKILSPVPTFAAIETVVAFNFSMIAFAAAINLASSSFLASKVASRAALFLGVARSA